MNEGATVLVVDDDPSVGQVLRALFGQAGLEAVHVESGPAALDLLGRRPVDVVVTDLRMPGMDGMKLLSAVREQWSEVPVVMLTAHGTVPDAVEAMKLGAADFLMKPFDREEVVETVRRVLARSEQARNEPPRVDLGDELIGDSAAMEELRTLLSRAARSEATVLLRGESGTGKELAARAIHRGSKREDGPFVVVNCAAIPDTLLESELFGHEKGAFTGATRRKPGRVELANGGTLFLDEIGDVPIALQPKLLRLLQEREIQPLGSEATQKVDVRFVAATHRDLEALVGEEKFREDLFYRLNVLPVRLPPLRERTEDIPGLVRHFCRELTRAHDTGERRFTDGALTLLSTQPWPGNVRELQSFVERLLILAPEDTIDEATVEAELGRSSGVISRPSSPTEGTLEDKRRDAEREALEEALRRAKGNRSLAARLLGISRRTLYNKLADLEIS